MKEIFITEWIYKRRTKERKTNPIRLPTDLELDKGNYLIKIYKLESK